MTGAKVAKSGSSTVRIAALAGFSGDRIDPAAEVLRKGNVNYGVFECLAERTIALAQQQKLKNPELGYDPLLKRRMAAVLPICKEKGIKIITNMGAANPAGAAEAVRKVAAEVGTHGFKVGVVLGDDILDKMDRYADVQLLDGPAPGERKQTVRDLHGKISANAYLGAEGIVNALEGGSDIVIAGRVSDPSLFLAIPMFEFGWRNMDYKLLGCGLAAGHLLECGAQVTGGYFSDGYSATDVPNLWRVGFPIAEISSDGGLVITKSEGSGGMVTKETCTAQLLYEIHDPSRYLTPDAVADFSGITFTEIGPNRVRVDEATATVRTETLKVSIGYIGSYIGEGEIGYNGYRARERALAAADIILKRLERLEVPVIGKPFVEIIGDVSDVPNTVPSDKRKDSGHYRLLRGVRLRVAARTSTLEAAEQIGNEVESLYTNGPAGGGGARKHTERNIEVASILVPRKDVPSRVKYEMI